MMPQQIKKGSLFCKTYRVVVETVDDIEYQKVSTQVESRQAGVIRTNCIDCLDRTNVAQQITCLRVLQEFVVAPNNFKKDWKAIEKSLIFLWAMAGDYISKQYSGTSSVLTQITLKGH